LTLDIIDDGDGAADQRHSGLAELVRTVTFASP